MKDTQILQWQIPMSDIDTCQVNHSGKSVEFKKRLFAALTLI